MRDIGRDLCVSVVQWASRRALRNGEIMRICVKKKEAIPTSVLKYQGIFNKNITTWTPLSVVLSRMWFLERLSAISVGFSSIDFLSLYPTFTIE